MDVKVRRIDLGETAPMNLLLLADPSVAMVEKYLHGGECFVAEWEGEIVGVYVLLPTRPETIELVNIAVREEKQGMGIGKKLVLDAVGRAKNRGYKVLEVGTGNSSIGQLALYQRCGFRITRVDHDFFVKHYEQEIYENGIQCRDMVRLAIEF